MPKSKTRVVQMGREVATGIQRQVADVIPRDVEQETILCQVTVSLRISKP